MLTRDLAGRPSRVFIVANGEAPIDLRKFDFLILSIPDTLRERGLI